MKIIALALCFLFFCQHAPARRVHSRACSTILKGYDSTMNRDDFVSSFPVAEQHRVLVCIDRGK